MLVSSVVFVVRYIIMRQGILITNGVVLKEHEMRTVVFFLKRGYNVELICPSSKQGARTPDFVMLGERWEMKSPSGKGKYLIRDTLRCAAKQSMNIVVDLRRTKMNSDKCMNELRKYIIKYRSIKKLIVIDKGDKCIEVDRSK